MQPFLTQRFTLAAGDTARVQGTQAGIILPVFKLCEGWFVDATGDYDLRMSEDGTSFEIKNTSQFTQDFAYRFVGNKR